MAFDPFTAGLGFLGGLAENIFGGSRASEANRISQQQAAINRDFQERMSSTAYQRGMADMKAAGLNPILAYQKGPASSPTGAVAQTTMAPVTPFTSNAISAGITAQRTNAEVDNLRETNKNLAEQNNLIRAQTLQSSAGAAKLAAETAVVGEQLSVMRGLAEKAKQDEKFFQKYPNYQDAQRWLQLLNLGGNVGGQVSSTARDINSIYQAARPGISSESTSRFGAHGEPRGSMTRVRVTRGRR